MSKEKLIAEIAEDSIHYVIYEQDEKLQYKILKKKIFANIGIKRGKILDFDFTSKRIHQDLKSLEKECNLIFKNISIVINEPDIFSTNLSGFKKLNGSKVEKRDLDFILNEGKSAILENQEKFSILHILNSNFFLDKKKKNKMPLNLHGDHLGLHMTFISLPKNNLKNIKALFNNNDLEIERIISKPLARGMDLLKKNRGAKNFVLINFDQETSSICLFEDSSLVFLKTFPFGTNSIYRDVIQLCSLKEDETKLIIKKSNLSIKQNKDNKYVEKELFTESEFKKISINHLNDIVHSRINEMLNYILNKNKNLDYLINKIFRVHLFFEDQNVLEDLGNFFQESLKIDKTKTQIELLPLDHFSALSGATELIFKGWDKEAIPLSLRKKSIISSFFGRLFN
tara:strand:- start:13609 stop:14802 length:1194 start_codon:yes stop_codon:yes gene_type:complete